VGSRFLQILDLQTDRGLGQVQLLCRASQVTFTGDGDEGPEECQIHAVILSNTEMLVRLSTDLGMWQSALRQAQRKVEIGGPPIYMYEFGWKTPCLGGNWATHGIDIPFVFGNLNYLAAWDAKDSYQKIRTRDRAPYACV